MKILIIRVSSLGDVLHNMPMVADILRHVPDAQIDWVVEEAYVSLVRLHPRVNKIIPFALRRWRKNVRNPDTLAELKSFYQNLRAEQYNYVLDTQGLLKTGVIMGLARTCKQGKKFGLANGTEGSGYEGISRIFHTDSVRVDSRTHAVLRGRLVAAAALGYTVDTLAQFGISATIINPAPAWLPKNPYAVFFHGTAGAFKKWPRENWIQTAQILAAYALPILLPWGNAAEKQEAESMAAQMPNAQVLPQLSMAEATLLAQAARISVGVDTGLTHIAAAYETPTIEIYSASPRWKTEGDWSDKIINLGDKGRAATVDEVRDALAILLKNFHS